MKVVLKACAKINLLLDIMGRRDDGYHIVKMVMQSVDLQDTVIVSLTGEPGEIKLICTGAEIPEDSSNIAYKAAELFYEETELTNPGICIKIKKKIPVAAGLAGGSADAAAVLTALNSLHDDVLPIEQLADIAENLGADVPFCLTGGTMLSEGIGTILSPLPDMPECFIVIAKPDMSVITAEAYKAFDSLKDVSHPDCQNMIDAICMRDLSAVSKSVGNVFEQVIEDDTVAMIRTVMRDNGASAACMSGSGPSVFGIFENKSDADHCASELRDFTEQAVVCKPSCTAIEKED